ncbi:MAG: HD-GYP domain-containing protein [Clostridiales bacterium]|jgi:putative nucleotidyltransferase with HDIG domain|nr:HD-GYP domain-containing protein [Eubacteriales bacterium]MDH7566684.1 HD-GYP domain-containing protein [Clostridiales bacterium]
MRKVHIDNIVPGAKVAKAIFTPDGRILLTSGEELKKKYIDKLRDNNITELYIEDEISREIDGQDVICQETRTEATVLVKNLMNNYALANTTRIQETVNRIINDLLNNDDILLILSDIKSVDDYTFEHSVNVCILSLIIGIGLGFNMDRLKELGVGALLHDIGKLRIPEEILKKPSQLTIDEFEEIKKHTIYGYEILKKSGKIHMVSAFIAFGHHERYDGSGYPLQLKGDNIHQFARIVAVADVYDALTSDRVYRKKLQPHEVIEYITSLGTHHFDQRIVDTFVRFVTLYPVGTGVILNTKARGLVVKVNKDMPTRPLVRIIYDEESKKLQEYYEIDLSKKLNVFIENTWEI